MFLLQERDLVCYYNVADIYILQQKENIMNQERIDTIQHEIAITSGWNRNNDDEE